MKQLYFLFAFIGISAYGQTLPYVNNFDAPNASTGWSHYAIAGTDQWELGVPTGGNALAGNLAWETALNATPVVSSNMALESPSFDLSNANLPYVMSFSYKSSINNGNLYLEYSTDNAVTWQLLNPATTLKKSWQSTAGFSLSTSGAVYNPAINLSFLQGNSNVKFRFRFKTTTYTNGFGWIVDNFSIAGEYYNVFASAGEPIEISPLCPELVIKTQLNFNNQYTASYDITTRYYFSSDMVLDSGDLLLGNKNSNVTSTITSWDFAIPPPVGLAPGQYYVLFQHDAANVVAEADENDNIGYCTVLVKPIYNLPYAVDFESEDINWKASQHPAATTEILWERGAGRRHHLEMAHSGTSAWHTSKTVIEHPESTFQWVESPYFNLAAETSQQYINFWFKDEYPNGVDYYDNNYKIQYSLDCSTYWQDLYTIPANESDEWEFINLPINATVSASSNVRFRITYHSSYVEPEGIIFDDFYIGPAGSDLTIEKIYSNNRYTISSAATDVLKYNLANSGQDAVAVSSVKFYWSDNNVLDGSDTLLGTQAISAMGQGFQWKEFSYTKPTAAPGNYFIIYVIDPEGQVNEFRETNNTGVIPIEQLPVTNFPYLNDFETNANQWTHDATLGIDEWALTEPQGDVLDSAFSGTKAWVSHPQPGPVSSMSRMHLYTPAFDLSNSENPVLEFDMKYDGIGGCSCFNITLNMSYSIDNGATWTVLETTNDSYAKWYQSMSYNEGSGTDIGYGINYTEKMFAANERAFVTYKQYNSRDIDRSTRYIISIPQLKDETSVRFRFNLGTVDNSDEAEINGGNEGALIDNFAINEAAVDLRVPYTKNLMISSAATKIRFSIDVKNSGNYISNPTNIKFYLSANPTYEPGDVALGTANLAAIRPDFKKYLSVEYPSPGDLAAYGYLVYVIDSGNTNVETDEVNNTGYFTLGQEGVHTFPYNENFEGDVVNGWHGYSYDAYEPTVLSEYRVTNRIAVTETPSFYLRKFNGILRTEYVPYGSWQDYLTPTYYIVSPVFDFTGYTDAEPLTMAFDYMCIGSITHNGGNMQYSTNGGATWTLLTINSGPSINWYPNYQMMDDMNNQPGWYGYDSTLKTAMMNISFLQGQSNVLFRIKYYSNFATAADQVRGFRLDNFVIGGSSATYDLSCIENIPSYTDFEAIETTCWEFGASDDEIILYDRDANADIHWEVTDHFAGQANNAAANISLSGQGNTNGVWMISPKFSMVAGAKLQFDVALTGSGSTNAVTLDADDIIKLYYSTDNGSSWELLKTWNASTPISATGQLERFNSLPATGFVRFAFWATNGTTAGTATTFYVDNFRVYTGTLGVDSHESFGCAFYPNPVQGSGFLKSAEILNNVRVVGISGQLLFEAKPLEKELMIDLSGYPSGVYFIIAESGEKVKHIKVIKE